MKFEYLFFNFLVIISPVLSLIIIKKNILQIKASIISIGVSAFVFIVWDVIVTGHFWYFNSEYVIGYKLITIPIEEALFFISVPFACLFLYVNIVEKFKNNKHLKTVVLNIASLFLGNMGLLFIIIGKYYTSMVFLILAFIWFLDHYVTKTDLLRSSIYWRYLGCLMLLTFCFNYYLTSRPIVIYNDTVNLNLRFLTIPLEDFIYAVCLVSLVIVIYEFLLTRIKHAKAKRLLFP